jgi:hypothetical protein
LQTYRDTENLHSRIYIRSLGGATLLRFDDVGYFNRIYTAGDSLSLHLPEAERHYAGCTFACELITPGDDLAEETTYACMRRGWSRGKSYSWLAARVEDLEMASVRTAFAVHEVQSHEQLDFLAAYLSAFEADRRNFPVAIRNMRHLFQHCSLTFHLATSNDEPVGVGITFADGDAIALCAGATLPKFRNHGCHHALLAARVALARERGYRYIYSWAGKGGQSESNMVHAGLKLVATTTAWRYLPA